MLFVSMMQIQTNIKFATADISQLVAFYPDITGLSC
jgi:hypothetical protein